MIRIKTNDDTPNYKVYFTLEETEILIRLLTKRGKR